MWGTPGRDASAARSLSGNAGCKPKLAISGCHLLRYGYRPSRMGSGYGGAGFGSRGGGALRTCTPIAKVTVSEHLLQLLELEMDPNLQSVKYLEKEQIKTFNNKFAFFIDKAREEMPSLTGIAAAGP